MVGVFKGLVIGVAVSLGLGGCGVLGSGGKPTRTVTVTASASSASGEATKSASAGASTPATATKLPDVPESALATAEVPANCELPAQRLVNGGTTKGSPGKGWMGPASQYATQVNVAVDLARLGYKQRLGVYGCSAGGVGWPETLVLTGQQGNLLASFDLGDLGNQEHATVQKMSADGNAVVVHWDSYEGAGFDNQSHVTQFSYASGKLVGKKVERADGETLDVSQYDIVEFASPSGRIVCSMNNLGVDCAPPREVFDSGKVPSAEEICPADAGNIDVGAVHIGASKTGWQCRGDAPAWPKDGATSTRWNAGGFGSVVTGTSWGVPIVALPYGKNLKHNGYLCKSRETGVTCRNANGQGFTVNRRGVSFDR